MKCGACGSDRGPETPSEIAQRVRDDIEGNAAATFLDAMHHRIHSACEDATRAERERCASRVRMYAQAFENRGEDPKLSSPAEFMRWVASQLVGAAIALCLLACTGSAPDSTDGAGGGIEHRDPPADGGGGHGGTGGAAPAELLCVGPGAAWCLTEPATDENAANCTAVGGELGECPFTPVGCCGVTTNGEAHTMCFSWDASATCEGSGGTWT